MTKYVPWYYKRSPPIFCGICLPVYMGVWPARKFVVIIGFLLFLIGILLLLGLLLTCIAVECSYIAGALLPFAIILIIAGLLILHCGWAAHLLDREGGGVPFDEQTKTTITTTRRQKRGGPPRKEEELDFGEIEGKEPPPEIKQGYWQFDETEAWQTVANPYPINYTLKPVIERQPYVP
uniref:Transmembrane protein n=1 Tax=Meloidogyne incognita TaxID=6306 RepID=A0A914NMN4_MELIC